MALLYSFFTTFWKKYGSGTLHPKNYEFGKEEIVLLATTVLVFSAIFLPYVRGVTPGDSGLAYEGQGNVLHLDESEKRITLTHGEIQGLVPAMTMDYDVESSELLRGLKLGDKVRFKLKPQGFDFVVVELWKEKNP